MSKIKIVTDSLSNITQEECEQYAIALIKLNVLVDGKEYTDADGDIQPERFFDVMQQAKELPKTSQPSIGNFLQLYDSFEEGTEIISIHVASSLSGTASAARQAGELSKNKVTVVDSQFADRGLAYQVIEAAKKALEGATKEDIIKHIQYVKEHTKLYIGVFTLENLVKGGRISRTKGLLSHLLNIKVIFEMVDGQLVPGQKGRGAKAIQQFLDTVVYKELKEKSIQQCSVSYVKPTEFINEQIDKLKTMLPLDTLHIGYTIPTVAIHTGEGAFAVIYYTN